MSNDCLARNDAPEEGKEKKTRKPVDEECKREQLRKESESRVRGDEVTTPFFQPLTLFSFSFPCEYIYFFLISLSCSLALFALRWLFFYLLPHTNFSSRVSTCACTWFAMRHEKRRRKTRKKETRLLLSPLLLVLFPFRCQVNRRFQPMNQVHQWIAPQMSEKMESMKRESLALSFYPWTHAGCLSCPSGRTHATKGTEERDDDDDGDEDVLCHSVNLTCCLPHERSREYFPTISLPDGDSLDTRSASLSLKDKIPPSLYLVGCVGHRHNGHGSQCFSIHHLLEGKQNKTAHTHTR